MLSLLILLIVVLLIAGVGYWAVAQIGAAMGLPAPIVVVAQVLIVLVALVVIVQKSGLL
jgi:hypothetical protein